MNPRSFLFLLVILSCGPLCAQVDRVQLLLVDSTSHVAIPEVAVQVGGRIVGVTDANGRCSVDLSADTLLFTFRHTSYNEKRVWLLRAVAGTGATVEMSAVVNVLDPVAITRRPPEVVFQRNDVHVATYAFGADGIWVLAYEKPRMFRSQDQAGVDIYRDVRLCLLDEAFVERAHCPFIDDAYGLYADHNGYVFIEGGSGSFLCAFEEGRIVLVPIERKTLHEAILPWTDSIPGWLLGNNRRDTYPAFDHFVYDPARDSSRVVHSISDGFGLELFRSQYKYMSGHDKVVAMDLAASLGTDKETVAGYMTGFYNDIYFQEPYAPLFVVHDTLCVFDQYRGRIFRYSSDLDSLGGPKSDYQLARDWRHRLLQDFESEEVYAECERNGHCWLQRVETRTGLLKRRIELTYRYPEMVQVRGGYVYYVYRPFASLQFKTLYREPLF